MTTDRGDDPLHDEALTAHKTLPDPIWLPEDEYDPRDDYLAGAA